MFYVKLLILTLFGFYWLSSLLANAPNCFVRIETLNYTHKFKKLFAQRWNFFAPPPKFNSRITYDYISVKGSDTISLGSFEVVEPIVNAKKKNKPFAAKEEILDYTINSAYIDFIDYRNKAFSLMKIKNKEATEPEHWSQTLDFIHDNFFSNFSTSVLYNYGVRLARQKKLNQEETLMKVSLYRIPITKFIDRNKEDVKERVELFYASKYHTLNTEIINPLITSTD